MSAYLDQLLSATGILPTPRPSLHAPDASPSDPPADFIEVSEEAESGAPEPDAGAVHTPESGGSAGGVTRPPREGPPGPGPGNRPSPPAPSLSAPTAAAELGDAGSASRPREPAEAVGRLTPAPPQAARVTLREIVEWVVSGDPVQSDRRPASGVESDLTPSQSQGRSIAVQLDPVARGVDGQPSREIGVERIEHLESPGTPPSASIESDLSIAVSSSAKRASERQPSLAPDEVSVSIGAIQVVIEGPRTVADRVVSEPRPPSLGSRLARRYLRPF